MKLGEVFGLDKPGVFVYYCAAPSLAHHITSRMYGLILMKPEGGALAKTDNQLKAEVGDTIRIFFGVGGPKKTSSFHIIGEMFDRAYDFGSLTSAPLTPACRPEGSG